MTDELQRRWDDTGQPAKTVRQMVLEHDDDIESLKAWREQLRGAFRLMIVAFGTSIVTGILSVAALVALLAQAVPKS